MSHKAAFNRAVIGLSMLAFVGCSTKSLVDVGHPDGPVDISALVPVGRVCAFPAKIKNPQSPVEYYISHTYRQAVGNLDGDISRVCLDRALDEANVCGNYLIGKMNAAENTLTLNPSEKVSHYRRVTTTAHELHHKKQYKTGVSYSMEGNVPERQRVIMELMMEADARVSEIIFVHKMEQSGHPEYAEIHRSSKNMAPLLRAFEDSLATNPTDFPAAMRASFLEFMKQDKLKTSYANKVMKSIEKNKRAFDPAKESYDLLSDENLHRLGEISAYNYMDDDGFKNFIRTELFTDNDYKHLVELRKHGELPCSLKP